MREEAEHWWRQAEHDLSTADYLLAGGRLDAASFYYQQAVEKALKSTYIHIRKEAPGATHSLTKLARDCDLPTRFLGSLRHLTGEYYLSRYPDAIGDVPFEVYDREEVEETSKFAHEVFQWLGQRINKS